MHLVNALLQCLLQCVAVELGHVTPFFQVLLSIQIAIVVEQGGGD